MKAIGRMEEDKRSVYLFVDGKWHRYGIGNLAAIPFNHPEFGLFKYVPDDQFAYWIDPDHQPITLTDNKKNLTKALSTLFFGGGGDTPDNVVWGANELLEWYEQEFNVKLNISRYFTCSSSSVKTVLSNSLRSMARLE